MISDLPFYVNAVFIIVTIITAALFFYAAKKSSITLYVLLAWLIVQAILAYNVFYKVTDTIPPRFMLMIAPPLLGMILLFVTRSGRRFVDNFSAKWLTYLHTVRIPVEIVLFWLSMDKLIPELMTFEGRNFDIFSGITAPFIAYFGYSQKHLSKSILLLWNFICLGLVLNVVIHGVLSVPSPFQQLAFDQPNVAILSFPFIWLPACIVPLVIFSHLVCIRKLILDKM